MVKVFRFAVVVLGATSALAISGTPVSAAPTSGTVTVGPRVPLGSCVPQIGVTSRSGNLIVGYGSLSNCGPGAGTATLTIQRSRFFGWQPMASATVTGPGYDQFVYYNCAGTGTHDFRTLIEDSLGQFTKVSNTITETC
jgi:hypothetical protein